MTQTMSKIILHLVLSTKNGASPFQGFGNIVLWLNTQAFSLGYYAVRLQRVKI